MTGPEHYREAELLLETDCEHGCPHSGCEHVRGHLARAQVHATLALAAATALRAENGQTAAERVGPDDVLTEWWRVAS
jgi:hypothetical protein